MSKLCRWVHRKKLKNIHLYARECLNGDEEYFHPVRIDDFVYCPYCGKEIDMIEAEGEE